MSSHSLSSAKGLCGQARKHTLYLAQLSSQYDFSSPVPCQGKVLRWLYYFAGRGKDQKGATRRHIRCRLRVDFVVKRSSRRISCFARRRAPDPLSCRPALCSSGGRSSVAGRPFGISGKTLWENFSLLEFLWDLLLCF